MALLTRREHSRAELRRKLLQREHDSHEVDAALDRLAERGLQSDSRYAEAIARNRESGGHGPNRIRADLRHQGLPEDDISAALEALDPDWTQRAVQLLERRFGRADDGRFDVTDQKLRNRQLELLLRRGFDQESARSAQHRWLAGF